MRGWYDGCIIKTVVGYAGRGREKEGGKNRRDRVRVFLKGSIR